MNSFQPYPKQQEILDGDKRFVVVAAGRRFGKTSIGKLRLVQEAERGGQCLWLSPNFHMSHQVWLDMFNLYHERFGTCDSDRRRIDLPTGGSMLFKAANAIRLDFDQLDFVVMDEAAHMSEDVYGDVVFQSLIERKGKLLLLSTPRGRNWFWQLFTNGPYGDWQSFQCPSHQNYSITPIEIDRMAAELPEQAYRQEILAEFVEPPFIHEPVHPNPDFLR